MVGRLARGGEPSLACLEGEEEDIPGNPPGISSRDAIARVGAPSSLGNNGCSSCNAHQCGPPTHSQPIVLRQLLLVFLVDRLQHVVTLFDNYWTILCNVWLLT